MTFTTHACRFDPKEPQKAEKPPGPEATEPEEVETQPKASSKAKAKAKAKGRAKTETPAAKTPGTKAPRKDPAEFRQPETVRRRLWQDSEDSEESPRKVKASPARGNGAAKRNIRALGDTLGLTKLKRVSHPVKFLKTPRHRFAGCAGRRPAPEHGQTPRRFCRAPGTSCEWAVESSLGGCRPTRPL